MHRESGNKGVVLFVSEVAPSDTHASSVLLFRHLVSIERAGYEIVVIVPENVNSAKTIPARWNPVLLPARRFWYPPYRAGISLSRTVRWILLDRVVRRVLADRPPAVVIGLLHGEYLVNYADWLSRRLGVKSCYFYHDRSELLYYAKDRVGADRVRRQNLRILSSPRVSKVWTVSPELSYQEESLLKKFRTVYPVPGACSAFPRAKWRESYGSKPVLAYVGSIYNEVIEPLRLVARALSRIGGNLHLYSHQIANAEGLKDEFPGTILYKGYVTGAEELMAKLGDEASATLVCYPNRVSDMPWSLDCFPSKLTQVVQTGLPCVVVAPSETSVGKWCQRKGWSLYSANYDAGALHALMESLRTEATWSAAANESWNVANNEFSGSNIEALVLMDLEGAIAQGGGVREI